MGRMDSIKLGGVQAGPDEPPQTAKIKNQKSDFFISKKKEKLSIWVVGLNKRYGAMGGYDLWDTCITLLKKKLGFVCWPFNMIRKV